MITHPNIMGRTSDIYIWNWYSSSFYFFNSQMIISSQIGLNMVMKRPTGNPEELGMDSTEQTLRRGFQHKHTQCRNTQCSAVPDCHGSDNTEKTDSVYASLMHYYPH